MLKQQHRPVPPLADEPDLLGYVEQTLAAKALVFRFPPRLERRFIHKRALDSQSFIHTGRHLLLLLLAVVVLNVVRFYLDIVSQDDYRIVYTSYVPLALAVLAIIFGPRLAWVRRHFYQVMAPVSIFILYSIVRLSLIYSGDYADFVVYHLMIAISLIAFGLRFVLPLFGLVLTAAGALSVLYAHGHGITIDYAKFLNYYLIYSLVTLALAAVIEGHERIAYLQSLLLDHHTAELKRLNEELNHIAHEDALTGLANRRSFDDIAVKEWDRALRDGQPLTLLLLDVDFFKKYNDFYGHGAGDQCLARVAGALQKAVLRTSDVVARYGGEEFAILLPGTKASGGVRVAIRILANVDTLAIPHAHSNVAPHVTVSIGVTTIHASPDLTLAGALEQADQALYEAKRLGRHRYVIHRPVPVATA